jgi:hypothetical protein
MAGDVLQQLQHGRHLALGEQVDLQVMVRNRFLRPPKLPV